MVVIALLLIIVGAGVAVSVLLENTDSTTLTLFGADISATYAAIFLVGAGCMLAILLGTWLLQLGFARSRRRRREVKSLKRSRSTEADGLEQERTRLAQDKADLEERLAGERSQAPTAAATPGSTSATRVGDVVDDGRNTEHQVDLTAAERRERSGR